MCIIYTVYSSIGYTLIGARGYFKLLDHDCILLVENLNSTETELHEIRIDW